MLMFIPTTGPRPGFYKPADDERIRKSREVPVNSARVWDRSGTPTQRTRTAYHESGHAVIFHRYGHKIYEVSIKRGATKETRAAYLGHVEADRGLKIEGLVALFGGSAAETIAFGEHNPDGCRTDKELAAAVKLWDDALDWRGKAMFEAFRILRQRWSSVEALAECLLEHETLTGDQVSAIITKVEDLKRANNARYLNMMRRSKMMGVR
jgi:ATP-dependent Zn protease